MLQLGVPSANEWACSAVGSAPEWHSGGHRFDPGQVHHPSLMNAGEGWPPLNELRLGKPWPSVHAALRSIATASRILQAIAATGIAETAIGAARPHRFRVSCVPMLRHRRCLRVRMPEDKRLVYVLKSATPKARYYIGLTSDVPTRLANHNAGRCPHYRAVPPLAAARDHSTS